MDDYKNEKLNLVKIEKGKTVIDWEQLQEKTSAELVEKVKKDYEEMHDASDFTFEAYYRDGSGTQHGNSSIVICIGHFIYSHFYSYSVGNGHIMEYILNQQWFEDIVNPFMKRIHDKQCKRFPTLKQRKV